MVEQLPVKELVPGSSPGRGANTRAPSGAFCLLREESSGRAFGQDSKTLRDYFHAGAMKISARCTDPVRIEFLVTNEFSLEN